MPLEKYLSLVSWCKKSNLLMLIVPNASCDMEVHCAKRKAHETGVISPHSDPYILSIPGYQGLF